MPIKIVDQVVKPKQETPTPAAETINPRRIAARDRKCCIRCGNPVPKGTLIERIPHPVNPGKGFIWIHAHCPDGVATQAQVEAASGQDFDEVLQRVEDLQSEVAALKAAAPRTIELKQWDGSTIKVKGCVNVVFDRVLQLASRRKNIFLPGPTGCGKTHLAEQVAQALGLEFSFISCSAGMSEGQITGRLLPVGDNGKFTYVAAEFVERYEKGGVFLFDEIDAADSNMLLVINSALANGKLALPNRPKKPVAKRHADFVCIAAANTWGKGADREYVGRNQLDDATLDRFRIGCVPMDYDPAVEAMLCPHEELRSRLLFYRCRINEARIKRPLSTRFMIDACDMVLNAGWTMEMVDEAFFSGWRHDEVIKVKG